MSDRFRHLRTLLVTALAALLSPFILSYAQTPIDSEALATSPTVTPAQFKPRPATGLVAVDLANDDGGEISLSWTLSPDDVKGGPVTGYEVLKAVHPDSPFVEIGDMVSGSTNYEGGNTEDGQPYYFKVRTLAAVTGADGVPVESFADSETAGPVQSSAQWFHKARLNIFIAAVFVIFTIMYMIHRAQSGKPLFIRKIAGLDAVDEAIGRATEMGKKVMYVPGIDDMDNVMTISSMIILGYVAEMTATYDTYLEVPTCKSMVMVTAKEVVKEAYAKVGRPDSYREDQVHYLTDDQFGYAAAIDGIVVREKPATMFYIGSFYAESLVLAEIGNAAGAIQIAGTAQPTQLPFFVTACDYTLLGEEMFAASAYLSREPRLLGSLKGQDYIKIAILAAIFLGLILETFGLFPDFSELFRVV